MALTKADFPEPVGPTRARRIFSSLDCFDCDLPMTQIEIRAIYFSFTLFNES